MTDENDNLTRKDTASFAGMIGLVAAEVTFIIDLLLLGATIPFWFHGVVVLLLSAIMFVVVELALYTDDE